MFIAALAGGVGGAKLADGLAQLCGARLSVIVNTGDDFEHLGLAISPDLDTVMYTLGGIANPATGWGVEDETWSFLAQLERFGGPNWFRLGDRDLATHVQRTARLRAGEGLTAITADLCKALGIAVNVLPMSDRRVATIVETDRGDLAFQEYFVRLKCEVPVTGFRFAGAAEAEITHDVARALRHRELGAVVLCPSNPYVSIAPILAVPGMRRAIKDVECPIVAVSPIIAGAAVKGPAAKMMRELGLEISAATVAAHYRGLIDGIVIDRADASLVSEIEKLGIRVRVAHALMRDSDDRRRLAADCLAFADELRRAAA